MPLSLITTALDCPVGHENWQMAFATSGATVNPLSKVDKNSSCAQNPTRVFSTLLLSPSEAVRHDEVAPFKTYNKQSGSIDVSASIYPELDRLLGVHARGGAPTRWYCCSCKDGPKLIANQPKCLHCNHTKCGYCQTD